MAENVIVAPTYHQIDHEAQVSGISHTPQRLEKDLLWLRERGFEFLTAKQAVEGWKDLALPERVAVVTFDDGFMGQYEEAVPILKRLEITATFFVVGCLLEGTFPPVMALQHLIQEIGVAQTEFLITERLPSEYRDYFDMQFSSVHEVLKATEPQDVRPLKAVMNHLVPPPHAMSALQSILETTTNQREIVEKRFMGKLQVKKLSGMGMEIGAHTQNHLPFVMVDLDKIKPGEEYNMHTLPLITTKLEEIDQEVAGGFDILQNMGLPVTSFAYPFGGRFPMEVQGIVAHHATSGWNYFTGRGSISQEEVFKNLFNIPRLDVDLYRNLGWLS